MFSIPDDLKPRTRYAIQENPPRLLDNKEHGGCLMTQFESTVERYLGCRNPRALPRSLVLPLASWRKVTITSFLQCEDGHAEKKRKQVTQYTGSLDVQRSSTTYETSEEAKESLSAIQAQREIGLLRLKVSPQE